jgi:cytochrome c oxidase subunit II
MRISRWPAAGTLIVAPGVAGAAAGCSNGQSVLHPGGPAADRIADLWWLMLGISAVIFLLVLFVLFRALTHRGERAAPRQVGDDRGPVRWMVAGGVLLPAVILTVLLVFTLYTLRALEPPPGSERLTVEVTGLQWWWDVRYVDRAGRQLVRTANEIQVPVGQPVFLRLRSSDVIHSFWIPALQGKMDLIPGRQTSTWLQADTPGVYLGPCAEYCGLQHTRMGLRVIALPEAEFAVWLENERRPAPEPPDAMAARGRQVFLASGCGFCHAVRGTEARGVAGPELTHLQSRGTLAAGTVPNTPGHLAGWIANPQALKPGNKMPRVPLEPPDLHALVRYLETLR